mmetsp:Transcript_14310/g.28879  ORF Transcript_14310/g.28879 Transcript_14310/m.28879 type:complete len:227 (-) Transcript_14310:473-1153(-)
MIHISSLARSAMPRVSGLALSSYRTFAVAASGPSSASSGAAEFIGRQAILSVVIGTFSSGAAAVALCDDGKGDGGEDDIMKKLKSMIPSSDGDGGFDVNSMVDKVATEVGSKVAEAIETGVPTQLSYGFMSGFCSGYALKKVGKAAAVVLGVGFMALQTLSYSGYVDVDHGKLKKDIEGMMDLNKDGKVDKDDLDKASENILEVLQFGLPAGAGFGAGFVFGLKQG